MRIAKELLDLIERFVVAHEKIADALHYSIYRGHLDVRVSGNNDGPDVYVTKTERVER